MDPARGVVRCGLAGSRRRLCSSSYICYSGVLCRQVPLSPAGRTVVRVRGFIAGSLLVAGLVWIVAGLGGKLVLLSVAGCVALLAGVIYGLLKAPVLRVPPYRKPTTG